MAALESAALTVEFSVVVRLATATDLPKLEWFGQFTHFRNLFNRTFREQQQGRRLMLIADCNNFPVGQIFVQLHANEFNQPLGQRRAYLYSLRVLDMFQGKGIGTLLLDRAEETVVKNGYQWANIAAAKINPTARRMYEHRGYRVFAEDSGDWNYLDHLGKVQHVHEPCWILEKRLHLR